MWKYRNESLHSLLRMAAGSQTMFVNTALKYDAYKNLFTDRLVLSCQNHPVNGCEQSSMDVKTAIIHCE